MIREILKNLLFLCLLVFATGVIANSLKFKHFGIKQGLPQATILCIYKSSDGRIWVGTQAGLSWFDGYQFHTFKAIANDSNSLKNDFIQAITEDAQGYIWVGTHNGGLSRLDPQTNQFISYLNDESNPHSISSNNVTSLLIDKQNRFWIGTNSGGLNLFYPKKQQFKHFTHNPDNPESISSNTIRSIVEDSKGHIWLALSGYPISFEKAAGISKFNPTTEKFTNFKHDPNNNNSLTSDNALSLYVDKQDNLWIGTDLAGLNFFNQATQQFTHYPDPQYQQEQQTDRTITAIIKADKNGLWLANDGAKGRLSYFDIQQKTFTDYKHNPSNHTGLNNTYVFSLLKDEHNLWVGTWWNGLNKLSLNSQKFGWLKHNPIVNDGFPNSMVAALAEDSQHQLLIGTEKAGVYRWQKQSNQFIPIAFPQPLQKKLQQVLIATIYVDSQNSLWIGTLKSGAYTFNLNTHAFKHYEYQKNNTQSIRNNSIASFLEYPKGYMWIATRGGGLSHLNIQTDEYRHFQHIPGDSKTITSNTLAPNSILLDDDLNIWFGTIGFGVNRINTQNDEITQFTQAASHHKISHNMIGALSKDKQGNIWVATYGGGIDKLSPQKNQYKLTNYNISHGFPSLSIDNLLIDDNDILWFTTVQGISRFNPQNKEIFLFDVYDGAMPSEYLLGAQFKGKNNLYIAGLQGITYFNPQDISVNRTEPSVRLNAFSLFNEDIFPTTQNQNILSKNIHYTQQVTLNHNQNIFGFSFTSLDYLDPERNQYAYKMQGFNDNWIYTPANKRFATYTNLDPGNYTFYIKASQKNGVWSSIPASIQLTIKPAPWKSWWAYSIYLISGLSLIYLFYYQRKRILIQKHKTELARQQQSIAEQKSRMAEKSNQAKSNFLAMMSHEIRTPINGVIGTVGILSDLKLTNEQRSYANIIKDCGENLLYIVNDILDLSKIEAGELSLEKAKFNLRDCIESALDIFIKEIDEKQVELLLICDDNVPQSILSDATRLRQVIVNLVGNSIKFTEKGNITIFIHCTPVNHHQCQLKFSVEDTGVGIPKEKQSLIFKAFKQADESIAKNFGGTGLGLTISQKIINSLGGEITIESDGHSGTTFHFCITVDLPESTTKINTFQASSILNKKKIFTVNSDRYLTLFYQTLFNPLLGKHKNVTGLATAKNELLDYQPDLIIINTNFPLDELKSFLIYANNHCRLSNISKVLVCTPLTAIQYKSELAELYNLIISKPLKLVHFTENLASLFLSQNEPQETLENDLSDAFAKANPMNILVAEDNAVNQKILLHSFRKLGYQPDIVSNGKEILNATKLKRYDLLLTDQQMPEMNGLDAALELRKQWSKEELRIIISSSNVVDLTDLPNHHDVVQDVLIKPFTLSSLKDCLSNCINR
ncbi:two-component regulator propeller domain-containing protein [Aliikangiella maris]|uniref:histidine kinase n=2 Tax=Aliikangiella maris TaxID=3162458 RepID=A0ABV2BU76_9GAMM